MEFYYKLYDDITGDIMKKKNFLCSKGFTSADIMIAIIIILIFISIISTSFYNYYISVQGKNRRAMATNALIEVIENVEKLSYASVTTEEVNKVINDLKANKTIAEQYTVTATLTNYNQTAGNENKEDLIKILKVTVKFKVGKRDETKEITTLIKNKGE